MSEKVAVVTGAAQGIGRRVAQLLAQRGYALALNDLGSLDDSLREVEARGAATLACPGDVSQEAVVEQLAARVQERWGRVDVLVNNAGISLIAPAERLAAADYRRV